MEKKGCILKSGKELDYIKCLKETKKITKKPAIIVDIDGVLANAEHRKRFDESGNLDWEHFLDPELTRQDTLMRSDIPEILKRIKEDGEEIILMSGRVPKQKNATIEWLEEHDIPYDRLIMREEWNQFVKDSTFKKNETEKLLRDHDILLAIDDMKHNRDAFEELGIKTLEEI